MNEPLLSPEQIPLLKSIAEKDESLPLKRRAQILLLYHTGQATHQIAESVGLSERSIQRCRKDFIERGMDMFSDVQDAITSGHKPSTSTSSLKKDKHQTSAHKNEKYPPVKKNTGIKVDDSMAEAGRKILRFHFARMVFYEKGTRLGEDIEELHDMRVATRRMRSAFDVFAPYFKSKVVKVHVKGLRAAGRRLGRVRDLDVFIEKAGTYLDSLPAVEHPGLEPLLNAWKEKRESERNAMLSHLGSEGYQKFKQDFNEFVSTPGAGVGASDENEPLHKQVKYFVPVLIYTQLAAVRSYESVVANATIEQLHALRTEFKKLRYTVENFREVLGKNEQEVIEEIKRMQDHLGNLNDADIACQILRQFIETWEDRQIGLPLHERKNPEPVVAYLAAKHAERHQLIVTFPEAWAKFNHPEFRKNLALAISVM